MGPPLSRLRNHSQLFIELFSTGLLNYFSICTAKASAQLALLYNGASAQWVLQRGRRLILVVAFIIVTHAEFFDFAGERVAPPTE